MLQHTVSMLYDRIKEDIHQMTEVYKTGYDPFFKSEHLCVKRVES